MSQQETVFLIDDDQAIRRSLSGLIETAGYRYHAFETAKAFFDEAIVDGPSCLLLDMRLGDANGVDVLNALRDRADLRMCTLIVSAATDISMAVKSIKLGAIEYLQKPVDPVELLSLVRHALDQDQERRRLDEQQSAAVQRVQKFTRRERELVNLLCDGLSNKQIAAKLDISIKTVANHRAHLLAKANASNTADMVRLVMLSGQYLKQAA